MKLLTKFDESISMYRIVSSTVVILCLLTSHVSSAQLFTVKSGKIFFESNAPQENIQASSSNLSGLMNININTFAFAVDIKSFKGFNSDLQEEHFYENYMQTDIFPRSTFSGKLIDKFNADAVKQTLRAKGQFEIHGVKAERIIQVEILKTTTGYNVKTEFNVLLEDHGIVVPKIVFQKIAENIKVSVSVEMVSK
jgi:hypothetical protein